MDSWRALVDWIYPKSCGLCSRLLVDTSDDLLCRSCRSELPLIEHACQRCGAPVPDPSWDPLSIDSSSAAIEERAVLQEDRVVQARDAGSLDPSASTKRKNARPRAKAARAGVRSCEFCKTQRFAFDQVMSYCVYRDGALRATRLIKESRHEALARCLGEMLGEWLLARDAFSPIHYDCVIPIPQHWIRRWVHRYNQAEVLAEGVGKRIDRPVEPSWLRRIRWAPKQGLRTIEERRKNMGQVFGVRASKQIHGKRVLLVDDVMTSGATLQDATRALKEAGAIGVSAVVFARGVSARATGGSQTVGPGSAATRPEAGDSSRIRRKIH